MTETQHIMVVDDDPRIRDLLRRYLEGEGFKVSEAADAESLRRILRTSQADLILLDLNLPGEDGLAIARRLRTTSNVPIIIVTGKGDPIDRVVGLELGADDYVTKPFHLREVLARIRSVLRRSNMAFESVSQGVDPEALAEPIALNGWKMDFARRELRKTDGSPVSLTTGEFDLLATFVRNTNRVLNRDQLLNETRGRDWAAHDRSIDTQVRRLRKKIEVDPQSPELIKTVRGVGYVFTPPKKAGPPTL